MSEFEESAHPLLGETSIDFKEKYLKKQEIWAESDFEWFVFQSSGSKGSIAKKLVERYLRQKGFLVEKGKGRGRGVDRLFNKIPTTIKSSALWEEGSYLFQQIRRQPYEVLICVGISPNKAHFWVIPKKDFLDKDGFFRLDLEGFGPQHRGKGKSDEETKRRDTFRITISDPQNPPHWLKKYGGDLVNEGDMKSLEKALKIFKEQP